MINPKINDKNAGFLALLLFLLIIYSLKSVLGSSRTPRPPCEEPVYIQIAGDIKNPGVYPLCPKAGLTELICRAGGLSNNSDHSEAFKDVTFSSGTKVYIRRNGQGFGFSRNEMTAFYKLALGIPVSLNRESENGLKAIPGIGPWLAKAIIRERSKRGGFKRLDELITIDGIGYKLYKKIRPSLKL